MDMSGATHRGGTTGSGLGGGHHGGGEWSGPTYSAPPTVTVSGPNVHGEGIGSQTFNQNLRTLQRQHDYNRLAHQRAHPFLSKIQSGLGSLGRGIGHIVQNFNPISFAFDNPLMKLLTSRYGQGNIRNLFQRNNQNINWNDPDEAEDIAWENINYNPNALTRLQMEEGIMNSDILPEQNYDNMFDNTYLADASTTEELLEKILNPDLKVDEFMDKKDQREKRQEELLKLIG
jgi:hypothetical protein